VWDINATKARCLARVKPCDLKTEVEVSTRISSLTFSPFQVRSNTPKAHHSLVIQSGAHSRHRSVLRRLSFVRLRASEALAERPPLRDCSHRAVLRQSAPNICRKCFEASAGADIPDHLGDGSSWKLREVIKKGSQKGNAKSGPASRAPELCERRK